MKNRTATLYALSLRSVGHRLRNEFAQEFVVFLCSSIIFATFIYVFNDFLNEHVQALSAAMRRAFAIPSAILSLGIFFALTHRGWRREAAGGEHLADWSYRLGEDPRTVQIFLRMRFVTIAAIYHGLAWIFIDRILIPLSAAQLVAGELIIVAAQLLWWKLQRPTPATANGGKLSQVPMVSTGHESKPGTRPQVLLRWRLVQVLFRSRASQASLLAGCALVSTAAYVAVGSTPPFVVMLLCFAGGNLASWSLAFQAASDLEYAWAERCMGTSHDEFQQVYNRLGQVVTMALAALFGLGLLLASVAGASSPLFADALLLVQCFLTITVCPLMMVDLLLQVDGRRPIIQMTLVTLLGLFLATGIFAHPLAVVLLPLFKYYAAQSQYGRYYRA